MNIITAIKLLFQVKSPAEEVVGELKTIKSGWTTLTWWAALVLSLGTLAGTLSHFIPPVYGLVATVLLTAIYNIIRMIQNAGKPGVQPLLLSTRFWMGVLGIVSTALISLKTNGIDPKWVESALAIIAAFMAAAQNVGATQPSDIPVTTVPVTTGPAQTDVNPAITK